MPNKAIVLAKEAERIALGKALGWLMEASEVYLGGGDDEFNNAWLNAENVMVIEDHIGDANEKVLVERSE